MSVGDRGDFGLGMGSRLRGVFLEFQRRDDFVERACKSQSARADSDLIARDEGFGLIQFLSIEESTISGPQVADFPFSRFEKNFGVSAARSFVGNRDFVGRSPADDKWMAGFQAKNVCPAVSLANNEVCRRIVWLHRGVAEITLRGEILSDWMVID